MQIVLDPDEAWSLMALIVSQVLDGVELSDDGRHAIKKWRGDYADGSAPMLALAEEMNAALGNTIDDRTRRLIRRKGGYVPSIQQEDA